MHEQLAPRAVRLLRTGIVPGNAIEELTVGYATFRKHIYDGLEEYLGGKHQKPLFVRGEWGTGKSHMLYYFRMVAAHLGLPTAFVSLNPRTLPLNYPQRLYGEIAASTRADRISGVRPLLEAVLADANQRAKLKHHLSTSQNEGLASSLVPLIHHFERLTHLNPRLESSWSYISGEDLGWADYPYKREQALERIDQLGRCFQSINGGGLLVLFDEVETLDQLWNLRSRTIAYDVVARISKMPSIWAVFAITERFLKIVKHDSSRNAASATWIANGLGSGTLPILDPPQLNRDLAIELATTIAKMYTSAHPVQAVPSVRIREWVDEWGRNPGRNPRRLIRLVVNHLDLLRPLPVS